MLAFTVMLGFTVMLTFTVMLVFLNNFVGIWQFFHNFCKNLLTYVEIPKYQ
jgi:hypothetical protein